MKSLLTITLVVAGMAASSMYLAVAYNESKATYDQSNVCIAKLVAQGVERADISRLGNTCFVN